MGAAMTAEVARRARAKRMLSLAILFDLCVGRKEEECEVCFFKKLVRCE
jgi:hypothetical protein